MMTEVWTETSLMMLLHFQCHPPIRAKISHRRRGLIPFRPCIRAQNLSFRKHTVSHSLTHMHERHGRQSPIIGMSQRRNNISNIIDAIMYLRP